MENILFLLLQGESFNNIGSSRLVYDMQNGAFPFDLAKAKKEGKLLDNGTQPLLNMSKVKFWIELGQLAPVGAGSGLYIHSTGQQSTVDEVLLDNFSLWTLTNFVLGEKAIESKQPGPEY